MTFDEMISSKLAAKARSLKHAMRNIANFPLSGSMLRLYSPRHRIWSELNHRNLRIAIVNLIPFLGDAIFYLPLVDAIKKQCSQKTITYIANRSIAQILLAYPGIDHVLVYPEHDNNRMDSIPILRDYHHLFRIAEFARTLRVKHSFDIALVPRGGADPFLGVHAAWLMNIARIYGYSPRLEPERSYMHFDPEPLMTDWVRDKVHLHESLRALEVAEVAGLFHADVSYLHQPVEGLQSLADKQDFGKIAEIAGLKPDESFAVIAPGASLARRRWPAERFQVIAERLAWVAEMTVLVVGSSHEYSLADTVTQVSGSMKMRNLAGRLSLLQLVGLLRKASLFVGNDSGPGHIAGALGIPTISLNAYAAAGQKDHHQSPERNRPIGPKVVVLQPQNFMLPCKEECIASMLHCLGQIGVEEVWSAINRLL
jgi:ADP-heptose:LPS heptosyltransferase